MGSTFGTTKEYQGVSHNIMLTSFSFQTLFPNPISNPRHTFGCLQLNLLPKHQRRYFICHFWNGGTKVSWHHTVVRQAGERTFGFRLPDVLWNLAGLHVMARNLQF
jgi:hypothetical protein